jgi:malate dehydrogenase
MGVSLDAARFANLIAEELNLAISDIEANVIASHGEGMLPLPRFTMVKGRPLSEWLPAEKIEQLVKRTVSRGTEIVSFLGTGSAYFGPAAAIAALVADIACKKEFIVGLSAYLDGEYGVKGLCIGVPCLLGAGGIKKIIELELDRQEQDNFLKAAASLRQQYELCSMI